LLCDLGIIIDYQNPRLHRLTPGAKTVPRLDQSTSTANKADSRSAGIFACPRMWTPCRH
jgi:hypothetical protein